MLLYEFKRTLLILAALLFLNKDQLTIFCLIKGIKKNNINIKIERTTIVGMKFKYKNKDNIEMRIKNSEKNIIDDNKKALKFEITSLRFLIKTLDPLFVNARKGIKILFLK